MFVAGCHRSGTSYLSSILSLLVDGSRQNDLDLTVDNPRGYFESTLLRSFNDKILDLAGYTWDRPPLGQFDWNQGRFLLEGVRVKNEFLGYAGKRNWVDKDPRLSLTFPIYDHILLERRPIAISVRSPAEVSRSLHYRDGFSQEKGLLLWFLYNRACAGFLDTQTDLIASYESLINGDNDQLERIGNFLVESQYSLREGGRGIEDAVKLAHEQCTDRSLRRHQTDTRHSHSQTTNELSQYCETLYKELEDEKWSIKSFKRCFDPVPTWIIDHYHNILSEGEPSLEYWRTMEYRGVSVDCTTGNDSRDQELIATYSDLILAIQSMKMLLRDQNEQGQNSDTAIELRKRIKDIESSTSWKITAPLRWIANARRRSQ